MDHARDAMAHTAQRPKARRIGLPGEGVSSFLPIQLPTSAANANDAAMVKASDRAKVHAFDGSSARYAAALINSVRFMTRVRVGSGIIGKAKPRDCTRTAGASLPRFGVLHDRSAHAYFVGR